MKKYSGQIYCPRGFAYLGDDGDGDDDDDSGGGGGDDLEATPSY